jgi:putative spermidine/putrescine transport system permease protein
MFDGMRDSLNPSITAVAAMLVTLAILLLLVVEWLRARNERLRKTRLD